MIEFISHHPDYTLPLPATHPFPMAKYALVHRYLLERGVIDAAHVHAPVEAEFEDILRVHDAAYVQCLVDGTLSAADQRRLGVPWSARLLRRSRLAVQGTIDAAYAALEHGLAGNLAGGTHHAFHAHGEGFCVLNDVVIAIARLRGEQRIGRAFVLDLDVHQGNGTAALCLNDAETFTLSMHGERNYPSQKMRSSLDVGLPDGIADDAYIAALAGHLDQALDAFRPDIVFYLAGVDVAAGDRYGRFALTDQGILRREQHVLHAVRERRLPLVITLAGGYAATPERTAELHCIVFEAANR